MKKQKIQLIVLVLILAALAGAFFGLRKYKEAQAQKPVEEEGVAVFELNSEDVINITYDYEGETFQYEKIEGTWYLAEDHTQTVKQYYLNGMAMGVSSVRASQIIENVKELGQYGLDTPQKTIVFDTAVQRFRIYLGDKNTMTGSYYIQLPDQPDTVYIVPETYFDRFNYGSEDIIEVQEEDADASAGEGAGTGTGEDAGTGTGTNTGTGADADVETGTNASGSAGTE